VLVVFVVAIFLPLEKFCSTRFSVRIA